MPKATVANLEEGSWVGTARVEGRAAGEEMQSSVCAECFLTINPTSDHGLGTGTVSSKSERRNRVGPGVA